MPTPVNEDGITRFKLSPEEREVIKLRKHMEIYKNEGFDIKYLN